MPAEMAMPTEEDAAPRVGESGKALTEEEKGAILQSIDEKKRDEKKQANEIAAAKKLAKFNIAKKDEAGSSSEPTAAGTGVKAAKALSPDKATAAKAGKAAEPASGGGVKAVAALKGKGKAAGGAGAKKGGGKGKGKMLAAAAEAAAEAPAAAPAPAPETAEERTARMQKEEEEREAERARLFKEREEQRREIEQAIWAEERRLREKESKKRAKLARDRKLQQAFRENAFDGELTAIKAQIDEWIEETMGCTLIGAKVDCADEHKTTALSEAACAGKTAICTLLLDHGAAINLTNEQQRTPLWRAAFMDHAETVEALLKRGADPRIKSDAADTPSMVAPKAELKALLDGWDIEETVRLMAENEKRLEGQWQPPPPDPADAPAGQAGYFLQCPMPQFQDALDAVTKESDRPVLVADLNGQIGTYLQFRDCNMHCYARPADVEPERIRIGLLGALRFGKPFVLDMMSLELDHEGVKALFDAVFEGLFGLILNKKIMKEQQYQKLFSGKEGEEYGPAYWSEATTAHYNFILLSKHPLPPEWCQDAFFVIRVA